MALLNYAKTLEEVKGYLNATESSTGDYVKLIFTLDGHIITHGADLLADYLAGKRGMVPSYNSELGNYAVFGKTGWEKLTTNHLPVANAITTPNADTIFTSQQIAEYVAKEIGAGFAANDAMVFKGGITKLSDIELPYSAGYTYRATESFTFTTDKKSWTVAPGDIVIATADSNTLDNNHFIVVEANINGVSEVKVNEKTYKIYTETVQDSYQFYAPTGPGVAGLILRSTNGVPEWANQSELNAGQLGGKALGELLDNVTASNGVITVTVGGVLKTATASGTWNITAAKVANALRLGEGLLFADEKTSYDGSEVRTINLAPATTTILGGVKVGSHISVDAGTISITKLNVIDALGFDPQQGIASLGIVTTEKDGFVPKIITTEGDLVQSYRVLAYNGTTPSWYTLPATAFINTTYDLVTDTTDGLISHEDYIRLKNVEAGAEVNQNAFSKINGIEATSKTDELTFSGSNVTITNLGKTITFSVAEMVGATTSKAGNAGLVKAPQVSDVNKFLKGDGTWATPVDTNTWRKILVGDTELSNEITSGDLRIQGTGSTTVTLANNILTINSTDTIYEGGEGISIVNKIVNKIVNLLAATENTLGGIKLGFTETGKKYAVKLDDNKAYVEVPWVDTKRDIQVNGTSIGENTILNIVPSEEIHIIKDNSDTTDVYEIGFGLSWYNISDKKHEYANQ